MTRAPRTALVLLLLLGAATPALGYDPALGWHTLETPNFVVTYHDGLGPLAQRTARASEAAHQLLVPILGHAPDRKVLVLLTDDLDTANGSATAFLRPQIHLYASPPDDRSELNDYEDYLWNLIVHEYTHVLHLDQIGGVPAAFNRVFGQLWIPNGMQPSWYVEGLAIWAESKLSGGGRNRSSLYDMYLRAQVLEDRFFDIDDASGLPSSFPRGAVPYLHGSRLVDWVERRAGVESLARINASYGSRLFPLAVNYTARKELGVSWVSLYRQWQATLTAEIETEAEGLRDRGLTPFRRLTFRGAQTGEPRFSGGRLLYIESSADRRASLREVSPDGGGDRRIAELFGGGSLAPAPGGEVAIVSQRLSWKQFYVYSDLHRVELRTGRMKQLIRGERLSQPDVSPDGTTVVAVKQLGGGRTALVTLPIGGGPIRELYAAGVDGVVYTPRFSPDGKRIAFSEQRPAGRDLRLLELETGEVRDLTSDRAIDLNPAFDPSGRYLLFSSDRTGVYNLFALGLETGETLQVSNVLTGAFRPEVSPDSTRIAFVTFGADGYDLAEMPFTPSAWRTARPAEKQRPAATAWEDRELYPARRYSPLRTVLPQYWLPQVAYDPEGLQLGLVTGGADLVGRHNWSLAAGYGLDSRAPAFDASYLARVVWPDLGFNVGSRLALIPGAPFSSTERQSNAGVSATFPLSARDFRLSLRIGYDLRFYDPGNHGFIWDDEDRLFITADRGLAASLVVGASFSNAQRFANSISPDRGFSLAFAARAARPEIGSQFTFATAEASATRYLAMPWLEHHALALRIGGGIGTGDLGNRRLFALGGLGYRNPLLDALFGTGAYGAALRGYAPGAFAGDRYVLGNAEYRFPLLTLDAGPWTLPLYLRRLHGALTFDVGNASNHLALSGLKTSVGGELRTELLLGYGLLTELRIGYARGLSEGGIDNFFLTLGSGF